MQKIMEKLRKLFTPQDMCVGAPWRRIAEFAFPMLIGNFAQQLYNTVDAVVVGNSSWGYTALASVGNAGPVLNLLLALFVGISTGAGVMVSQYYGARDSKALSKTIGNCITVTAIASVIIMIIGPLLTMPLLRAMNTLDSMIYDCRAYLNIFFYGIAGFFFYNIFAGVLRGLGDSLSSLGFLLLTSLLNVGLDLLLVEKYGVAGVAYATIFAQFVSAILCLVKIMRIRGLFTIDRASLKPDRSYVNRIIGLGLPSGVTQAIFSCATLVVQRLINGFGDEMFVACNVMVMRVDGYAMLPNFSFGQAMTTFAGQNVGAKRIDRLQQGTRHGLIMALGTSLVLTPLVLLGGPWLMRLFTPEQTLVDMSMTMMYILAVGYVAFSVTQVYSGVMRGAGDTMTPMWISLVTTVGLRVPLAYLMVYIAEKAGKDPFIQKEMVFVSLLAAWIIGMVINVILFKKGGWKKKQVAAIERELAAQTK